MISFSGVAKRYPGGHEALTGVSFAIEAGEFAFVAGHSGAGKSTLLKLIPVIERPSSGAVLVNGQNVGGVKGNEASGSANLQRDCKGSKGPDRQAAPMAIIRRPTGT